MMDTELYFMAAMTEREDALRHAEHRLRLGPVPAMPRRRFLPQLRLRHPRREAAPTTVPGTANA